MGKTMTFEEMIANNPDIYWNTDMRNDTVTQAITYDWFRFRRVTSNRRFPLYFQRVINRDYTRYKQLLRIEAGKLGGTGRATNYDWLVNEYFEELGRNDGTENVNATENKGTELSSRENKVKGTDYTKTVTHSGSDSSNRVSESNYSNDESNSNTYSGSNETDVSEHSNAANTTQSRAGAISRANPQSSEYQYSGSSSDTENDRHGFAQASDNRAISGFQDKNDASFPSTASQTAGFNKDFPNLKIKNPTSTSDSLSTTGAVTETDNKSNNTSVESASSSGTSNSNANSTNEESDNLVYGHVITTRFDGDTENDSLTKNDTEESEKINTGSKIKSDTNAVVHTGRKGNIADMLQEVIRFIDKSSAWDWYREQLETCFMQCFDEEEEEVCQAI